eukprot:sb/3473853/
MFPEYSPTEMTYCKVPTYCVSSNIMYEATQRSASVQNRLHSTEPSKRMYELRSTLSGQCSDHSSRAHREKREVGQANALTGSTAVVLFNIFTPWVVPSTGPILRLSYIYAIVFCQIVRPCSRSPAPARGARVTKVTNLIRNLYMY